MPMTEDDLRRLLHERSARPPVLPHLVDRVEARARRRRSLELGAAAVMVVAVLVGVALLMLPRPQAGGLPVGGPSAPPSASDATTPTPTPSPSESITASASPSASGTTTPIPTPSASRVDASLPPMLGWDSTETFQLPGSTAATSPFGLKNRTKGTVTVTGWHIDDPTGATTGALFGPESGNYNADFQPDQVEAALSAPPRSTAEVGAGQTIFVFLRIQASCTPADKAIAPTVVLDLRAADGTRGQFVIHPLDGYDVGYGMPYGGWVEATLAHACMIPSP